MLWKYYLNINFTIIFDQRAIECLKPFEASTLYIVRHRYYQYPLCTCPERTPIRRLLINIICIWCLRNN